MLQSIFSNFRRSLDKYGLNLGARAIGAQDQVITVKGTKHQCHARILQKVRGRFISAPGQAEPCNFSV